MPTTNTCQIPKTTSYDFHISLSFSFLSNFHLFSTAYFLLLGRGCRSLDSAIPSNKLKMDSHQIKTIYMCLLMMHSYDL